MWDNIPNTPPLTLTLGWYPLASLGVANYSSLEFDNINHMKKTVLLCSCAAIVAFVAGFKAGQPNNLQVANYNTLPYKIDLIKAYDGYYKANEALLDTLDNHYDWVDAFDPCDYYEAKSKLDSLLNLEAN